MNYLFFNPAHPVKYLSCGILESEDGFVHPKRNIDSHVLILVQQGTLPVTGQSFFSFSQLIHTAKREEYRPSPKCSYATMLLLLEASQESLSEYIHQTEAIARQCGFSDVKYFYRMFKKEAQITPNEYRKNLLH